MPWLVFPAALRLVKVRKKAPVRGNQCHGKMRNRCAMRLLALQKDPVSLYTIACIKSDFNPSFSILWMNWGCGNIRHILWTIPTSWAGLQLSDVFFCWQAFCVTKSVPGNRLKLSFQSGTTRGHRLESEGFECQVIIGNLVFEAWYADSKWTRIEPGVEPVLKD